MQEPYYSYLNCEVLWLKCCFQNALEKLTRFAHWKPSHFNEDWTVHLKKNSKNNELFICVVLFSATYLPRTHCMHSECLYGNMTAYRRNVQCFFFHLVLGVLWQCWSFVAMRDMPGSRRRVTLVSTSDNFLCVCRICWRSHGWWNKAQRSDASERLRVRLTFLSVSNIFYSNIFCWLKCPCQLT